MGGSICVSLTLVWLWENIFPSKTEEKCEPYFFLKIFFLLNSLLREGGVGIALLLLLLSRRDGNAHSEGH